MVECVVEYSHQILEQLLHDNGALTEQVMNLRDEHEETLDLLESFVSRQTALEEYQDYVADNISQLAEAVDTAVETLGSNDDVQEFYRRVAVAAERRAVGGPGSAPGTAYSQGVPDDAPARNKASVRGRDVNPTGSRGDHGGVYKEAVNEELSERETLRRIIGVKGTQKVDGTNNRKMELREVVGDGPLNGKDRVSIYCELLDEQQTSWASDS
jgi:hypothetical protein